MGFSQGGLIARYVATACDIKGKVRNLITVGTPNMGASAIPTCGNANALDTPTDMWSVFKGLGCNVGNFLGNAMVYSKFMQDDLTFSPNGYVRNVDDLDTYIEKSSFLPIINNEVIHENNAKFRERMINLNTASFIMWDRDTVIYPRES
jgi:triacylglycerol esterase/lipase EstA (alpha/beta hydrolase family)